MDNLKLYAVFLQFPADTCQCMPSVSILFWTSVDCYNLHFFCFDRFTPFCSNNESKAIRAFAVIVYEMIVYIMFCII